MAMKGYSAFPKAPVITIRLFSVIYKTLMERGGLTPLQRSSWRILQTHPTECLELRSLNKIPPSPNQTGCLQKTNWCFEYGRHWLNERWHVTKVYFCTPDIQIEEKIRWHMSFKESRCWIALVKKITNSLKANDHNTDQVIWWWNILYEQYLFHNIFGSSFRIFHISEFKNICGLVHRLIKGLSFT